MTTRSRVPLVRRVALYAVLLIITASAQASAQSEAIEYYGLDALGSVRVIFDQQGNVVGRMDYGPFGENLRAAIKFPTEQFAQLARDAENGHDYAQARIYSPQTGRFNAPDPVFAGLYTPQKWNRYAYSLNCPQVFTDRGGLDPDLALNAGMPFWTFWRALGGTSETTVTADAEVMGLIGSDGLMALDELTRPVICQ